MATRDLYRKTLVTGSLSPAVRVTGAEKGSAVDLRGFDAAVISVAFGNYTDGTHVPSIEHSMDGTTYTAVAGADLDGALTGVSESGSANKVQSVGYIGSQRYVRVAMTVSGATSGAYSSAFVIAGYPHSAPVV